MSANSSHVRVSLHSPKDIDFWIIVSDDHEFVSLRLSDYPADAHLHAEDPDTLERLAAVAVRAAAKLRAAQRTRKAVAEAVGQLDAEAEARVAELLAAELGEAGA